VMDYCKFLSALRGDLMGKKLAMPLIRTSDGNGRRVLRVSRVSALIKFGK